MNKKISIQKSGLIPALLLCLALCFISVVSFPQPLQISILGSQWVNHCPGDYYTINTITTGGTPPYNYTWSPALGNTPNPTVSPLITTQYIVKVVDALNDSATASVILGVMPKPEAGFSLNPASPCSGTPVSFTDTSNSPGSSISSWFWEFGQNNVTSTLQNPSHTYTSVGSGLATYQVKLTVTNSLGCKDDVIQAVQIKQEPSVSLVDGLNSPPPFAQCVGPSASQSHTLTIFNTSSTLSTNVFYSINWGDTSAIWSDSVFPAGGLSHVYSGMGYFEIIVNITGQNGCTATKNFSYFYGSNPAISLGNPGNTTGGCVPPPISHTFPITYTNSNGHPNTPGTIYTIVSNSGFNQSFTQPVTGMPPSTITIPFSISSCNVSLQGSLPNTFYVRIIATNACGTSTATVEPITISNKPTANFSIQPPSINNVFCPGVVTFNNTSLVGQCVTANAGGYDCNSSSMVNWSITPSTGWNVTSGSLFPGSNALSVNFSSPGTYNISMINTNCCGPDTIIKQICIRPNLVAAFSPIPQSGCSPLQLQINNPTDDTPYCGVTPVFQWSVAPTTCPAGTPPVWSFTNNTNQNSKNPSLEFITPGTYEITLIVSNACGIGTQLMTQQTITVFGKPQFTLSPPVGTICQNDPVQFSAPTINPCYGTPYNYQWSFPGATPASFSGQHPGTVVYTTAGNKSVTLNVSNICGNTSANTSFIVTPKPATPAITHNDPCEGDTLFLGTPYVSGATYHWTGPMGFFSTVQNPFIASVTSGHSGVYKLVISNGDCPSDTAGANIQIISVPSISINVNPTSVCLGGSVTVTGNGANAYVWTANPAATSGMPTPATGNPVTIVPTGSGSFTISVTGIDTNGCRNIASAPLIVYPLPNVNAGPDDTICANPNQYSLLGATPPGGGWSGTNVTGGMFNPSTVGSYTLTYTYTDGNYCTDADTRVINVISAVPVTATPADTAFCLNDPPFYLSGAPTGGTWSGTTAQATAMVNANTGLFTPNTVGTYYLVYKRGVATCEMRDTLKVTVHPLPNVNVNPSSGSVCIGDSITLTAQGASTYLWQHNNSPAITVSVIPPGVGAHSYAVDGTDSNGCKNTGTSVIQVNPLPAVNAGPDDTICANPNQYSLLGATPPGGGWSGTNVTGGMFNPSTVGSYTLTYTYTDGNNCTDADTRVINVISAVPVTATPADTAFCLNDPPFYLSGAPTGGTWSGTTAQATAMVNANTGLFTPNTVGTYYLVYKRGVATCEMRDTLKVTVHPLPNVNVNPSSGSVCIGDSITLTAQGASTYLWQHNNSPAITVSVTPPGVGAHSYAVDGTDSNGCKNTGTSVIQVNPLPAVNAGPDDTICANPNQYSLLGATPPGGGWSGTNVTGGMFNPSTVGSYTLTYTYTDGNNCTDADTRVINVISAVPVTATPADTAFCLNDPPFYLSGAPTGGTWSGTTAQATAMVNANTGLFTPNTVGTYYLVYKRGVATCEMRDTLKVTVHPLPNVNVNPSSGSVCIGDSITLTAQGASTYLWQHNNSPAITVSVIPPGVGAHSYAVDGTDSNGCKNTGTSVIQVNPLPAVNAGPNDTICVNPNVFPLLGATPPGGGWSGTNVTGGMFNPSTVGSYTLTYTYTDGNNCTDADTRVINVISAVPVTATPADTAFCLNDPPFYLSGAPTGGTWSGTTAQATAMVNANTGLFTPNTVGTFYLVYKRGVATCEMKDTLKITVHPLPNVTVFPVTDDICIGDTAMLTAQGNVSFLWLHDNSINPVIYVAPLSIGTNAYSVTGTDGNGCKQSATSVIQVHPIPVPAFSHADTVCLHAPVPFTNQTINATNYLWDFDVLNPASSNSILLNPSYIYQSTGTFTIELKAGNPGCERSRTDSILVIDAPVANFQVSDTICSNMAVNYTNLSTFLYSNDYLWDLGFGSLTTTQVTPSPTIYPWSNIPANYLVKLKASNQCGNDSITRPVHVIPFPVASFAMSFYSGCSLDTIEFFNNSTGSPTNFIWNFDTTNNAGPVVQTNAQFPSQLHWYNNTSNIVPDTHYIMLTATNICGTDSMIQSVTTIPATVTAFMNAAPLSGCAPLTVHFSSASAYSGSYPKYIWDFGTNPPSGSTNQADSFTYTIPNTYYLTLIVDDSCSRDTITQMIEVYPPPVVSITSPDTICTGDTALFAGVGSPPGLIWEWDIAGGPVISNFQNASHVFQVPGTYQITLTGTESSYPYCSTTDTVPVVVLTAPSPMFTMDTSSICAGLSVQFLSGPAGHHFWDFGDATGSGLQNPVHTYGTPGIYSVQLSVANNYGCVDSAGQTVYVWPIPVAAFAVSPDSSCISPAMVSFTNQSSGANDYLWDFGDATTSTLLNPTHLYDSVGHYTISLTVRNMYDCFDTTFAVFDLFPTPIADFSILPEEGCQPLSVQFNNLSQQAISQIWDFGDGTFLSSGLNPNHTYLQHGTYSVLLKIMGTGGCTDSMWQHNAITVFPKPIADFTWSEEFNNGAKTGILQFTNTSLLGGDAWWNFGDGNTSYVYHPLHRYSTPGSYNVQLIEENQYGCLDTIVKPVSMEFHGLFVSNAFSPDFGPEEIRVFKPKGVGLKYYHFMIYDTWGNLIWESDKVLNGEPAEGWDGTLHGTPLPQDVYVWKLNAVFDDDTVWPGMESNGKHRTTGTVTLLR
jgi:large repetitive protein